MTHGILHELNALVFPNRLSSRAIMFDKTDATSVFAKAALASCATGAEAHRGRIVLDRIGVALLLGMLEA